MMPGANRPADQRHGDAAAQQMPDAGEQRQRHGMGDVGTGDAHDRKARIERIRAVTPSAPARPTIWSPTRRAPRRSGSCEAGGLVADAGKLAGIGANPRARMSAVAVNNNATPRTLRWGDRGAVDAQIVKAARSRERGGGLPLGRNTMRRRRLVEGMNQRAAGGDAGVDEVSRTAFSGEIPNNRISSGVISEPPPTPVMPTRKPTPKPEDVGIVNLRENAHVRIRNAPALWEGRCREPHPSR